MAIADDFSVGLTGDIRYVGAGPNYTVLELHRFLQDLADDAVAAPNDLLDISGNTPSDRSTDNIITLINGFNIDDAAAIHLYDGSVTQTGGATIYAGLVVVGAVVAGTNVIIIQNNGLLTDTWSASPNANAAANIILRALVKTRDLGADIDGQRLIVQAREYQDTYAEFLVTMGLGNNTAALFTASDLNNQTAEVDINALAITNTEGYQGIDVTGDGANEFYYSQWDVPSIGINNLYEFGKDIQRRGTAETLYGMSGALFRGITHEIVVDTHVGTFLAVEPVSWATGTGQMLAINSLAPSATKMWIQLLTGTAPTDGAAITGGTSGATVAVNVTVTARTVPGSMMGNSTGSAIIGAYGLGVVPADLAATDQLFDLNNALQQPPNNVSFTVSGLVVGDRILVGPEAGGVLDVAQFTLATALSGVSETQAVINGGPIPTDTPAAGTIRIQTNAGIYRSIAYQSYSGSTFVFQANQNFGADNASIANNVFISYIDKAAALTSESFTSVFDVARALFIRVRDGGPTPIKTFETTGTLGSAGGSATAIRTSDA